MTLFEEPLFLGWAACMGTAAALVIYAMCRTNFKRCAARIASSCVSKKPDWGKDDELDELIDFGTHKKALQQLKDEFTKTTHALAIKVAKLESKRPIIVIAPAPHSQHFKPHRQGMVPHIDCGLNEISRMTPPNYLQ